MFLILPQNEENEVLMRKSSFFISIAVLVALFLPESAAVAGGSCPASIKKLPGPDNCARYFSATEIGAQQRTKLGARQRNAEACYDACMSEAECGSCSAPSCGTIECPGQWAAYGLCKAEAGYCYMAWAAGCKSGCE